MENLNDDVNKEIPKESGDAFGKGMIANSKTRRRGRGATQGVTSTQNGVSAKKKDFDRLSNRFDVLQPTNSDRLDSGLHETLIKVSAERTLMFLKTRHRQLQR
ncbi:hypothetical protein LINGRAHAP2_LOCUS23828 [Linum grandiflorum]